MNCNLGQQPKKTARVRRLFATALMLGCALGTASNAAAQKIASPTTPADSTPPAGKLAFLFGPGGGTPGYFFLPPGTRASRDGHRGRPRATPFHSVFRVEGGSNT